MSMSDKEALEKHLANAISVGTFEATPEGWLCVEPGDIDIIQTLERLRGGYVIRLQTVGDLWQASFEIKDGQTRFPVDCPHNGDVWVNAETLPLAIYRAALKVAENEQASK